MTMAPVSILEAEVKSRPMEVQVFYIGGLNGNNANGAARFTATDLTIDVQGYSAMGINVQKNSVVDLEQTVPLKQWR